jgi:titin
MNTLNIIGYSLTYSPILSVPYAVIPDSPAAPEYVTRHGGEAAAGFKPYITIKWKEPVDNGGSPILGFKIEVTKDASPTYVTMYDGSADAVTKEFKFRDLVAGSTYGFRVYARNQIGWCAAPSSNILVYASTYPHKMDAPTLVVVNPDTGSGKASIKVKWTALASGQDGGSPVLGYYLQQNTGYTSTWVGKGTVVASGVTEYTATDLIPGATYNFRIAAYNILEA